MPTLTAMPFLSLYNGLFTLYQSRKLWKTFNRMHGVFCSLTLEESHLSDAGLVMDKLHFVVLPQSHSSKFVPLGWWWCTWSAWPAQPCRDESPLLDQWEKIDFSGGFVSIQSTGFSWDRKGCPLQCGAPLHTFPSPTNPSPFSSPVGIGFSQDWVTWLQWNDISFSIIVPLLSLCLWGGWHLSLFEGFSQSFMQLSNVVVNTLIFLCTLDCGEIEVNG